jgi:hypothetical protein
MPKILKSAIAAAVLAAGLWFASVTPSYTKPEYAKTEGKACGYWHVTAGKPELNAAGDLRGTRSFAQGLLARQLVNATPAASTIVVSSRNSIAALGRQTTRTAFG